MRRNSQHRHARIPPYPRGSTLVEMMVAVGVFFLIIGLVFSITGSSRMSWNISQAMIYLQSQARNSVTSVTGDLIWSTPTKIFVDPDRAWISFQVPVVDPATDDLQTTPAGEMAWGDGDNTDNYIDYRVIDGNLVRQILNPARVAIQGTQRIIARCVVNFNVTLNGLQPVVTIGFSMNNFWGAPLPSAVAYNVTTGITPRN